MSLFAFSLRSLSIGVAGALVLSVGACGGDTAPEPISARILIVSGNNQEVHDGDRLAEPLTVRVVRAGGIPTPNIEVHWNVVEGAGEFHGYPDDKTVAPAVSFTDLDGIARIYFLPLAVGSSTITASAEEVTPTPVKLFAHDRPKFEMSFGPVFDCTPFTDPSRFSLNRSMDMISQVNVPVTLSYFSGLSASCTGRVKTVSVPAGAQPFDTGILHPGEPFVFTPRVAGEWELTDVINGGTGRLIVR